MLQNRVDPYGNIIRTPARGNWTGNRGVLHNGDKQIVRLFKLKAWITCVLEHKGIRRQVMTPDRWTELFFRDEATSFSAGHRPCCECRRTDFNNFKHFWLKGNSEYGFNERVSIQEIDKILHAERILKNGSRIFHEEAIDTLPDGTFIEWKGSPGLILNGLVFQWSPGGYSKSEKFEGNGLTKVLTPRSIVNTFRAGYCPQIIMELPNTAGIVSESL
jgi:hypothetical protein